ncbi:hypothetical protein BH10BAC5_BH10BAC5_18310 [soil metagenome]
MEKPFPDDFGVTELKVKKYLRNDKILVRSVFIPFWVGCMILILLKNYDLQKLNFTGVVIAFAVSIFGGFVMGSFSFVIIHYVRFFIRLTNKDHSGIIEYVRELKLWTKVNKKSKEVA